MTIVSMVHGESARPMKHRQAVPEQYALDFHRHSLVVDMHSDVHLDVIRRRGLGQKRVLETRHLSSWQEGHVDVVILSTLPKFGPQAYPYWSTPVHNLLLTVDALQQEISESPGSFLPVLEADDIVRAKKEGRIGLMLGVEGAEALMTDLGFLRCFYQLGLRVMNLTWHQRNQAADGVAERSNGRLSNFGMELVRELNRLGIIIDVSHLSPAGLEDTLAISEQPVMASHSNARAVCDNPRNLQDGQIRAISEKGGMIGIVFLGRFVAAESPVLDNVLDHVDHITNLVGAQHIGIGPDYVGGCDDMIINSRRVAGPEQPVDEISIPYAEGLEDAGKLTGFTEGLLSRGYDEDQVRGILGRNFLNFFRSIREGKKG